MNRSKPRPFPMQVLFVWQVKSGAISLVIHCRKLKVVGCFKMNARSEESLKKDDNDGKSDSDGDFFDKIRSLFGDAICEALQSKLKFLFIRRACTPEDFKL